ncbi:MAG: hypothetical protein Q8910_00080 [Bacteroidota bacterium]|nr:hypothetical protein [Bacteroidota bacterium]
MNINIGEIVNQKIKEMDENKVVEKAIKDTLENTIIKAVNEALSSWKLKDDIEKKVSKEVSDVVADIGFTAYNSFIAEKVKAITEDVCTKDIAEKIQKTFDNILVIKRDKISLSDIFDKYREWICANTNDKDKYDLERYHVKFDDSERGWLDIELSREKMDRYTYKDSDFVRFTVHRNYDNKNIGWISRVELAGEDIEKKLSFKYMNDFQLLLINLAYNKTPVDIDVESEDDIDNSFDVDY